MTQFVIVQIQGYKFAIDFCDKKIYRDARLRGYTFAEIECHDILASVNTEIEFYPYREALAKAAKLKAFL